MLVPAAAASAAPSSDPLQRYAEATWASFVAMTDAHSGLPADSLDADGTRSVQTSTTNIGAYMWSALVAERLHIIGHRETVDRLGRTITTLEHMERHEPDGQFWNWYDDRTGAKLTTWPPTGDPIVPQLSSVDNGWLAVGLQVVASRVPELRSRAQKLFDSMDFGFYYRPAQNQILFNSQPDIGAEACCYNTIVSESRIASYIGIEKGELPPREYYGAFRTFPVGCDMKLETRPIGFTRSYLGQSVFEGAFPYNGTRVTPSWGGSMFEALMPALFLPEERWGPGSWGSNHPLTVRAQIHHGLVDAGYGYWGFSPANIPEGGYSVYGVDAIGMDPDGNPSNEDRTLVDHGYPGCPGRDPQPDPPPSAYTNGVVTPHAAFLALRFAPREAVANLGKLARDFPSMYGKWGFRDSVNVDTGTVSQSYLSLDQGMIMAAIGNALGGDLLRHAFVTGATERRVRPLIGVEEFNSSPRGCTITGTPGADHLRGTSGHDVICGLGGDDVIDGRGGDDAIFGDAGRDRLEGGDGADTLYGDDGDDNLSGGRGDDVLSGGPGTDRFDGGPGSDFTEQG
jgi:Putative glucoamylase/RTX calcium-binding nonapeptide repeat (4 copies)/Protein of unknown function (DUF3131)